MASALPASSLEHAAPEAGNIFVAKTVGGAEVTWVGKVNYTYFVHISPLLQSWSISDTIQDGAGNHTFSFTTTADKLFTRLRMTNLPTNYPGLADFDGDGIGSQAELDSTPQTDPLSADSDGDGVLDGASDSDSNGLGDGWEIIHFGSIGQSPTADPDGDGFNNLDEFLMGGHPMRTNTATSSNSAVDVYQPN